MGEFHYRGIATVVGLSESEATLCPADDVLGGPGFMVPLTDLGVEVDEGVVLKGEFLLTGGEWLVDASPVGRATTARAQPRAAAGGWDVGTGRVTVPFAAELGGPECDALGNCTFWRFNPAIAGVSGVGHFQDARGFLTDWAARREAKERGRAEAAEKRRREQWLGSREFDQGTFVNPYNFVPLPADPPERREPAGHAWRRSDLLHGRIELTLTARTPLLLRDSADSGGSGGLRSTRVPTRDRSPVLPGSSMKGAVRVAFEAITGSCLRVVDEDFVPAYRDVLRAENKVGWYLIEVVEVDRMHMPTRVRVCTEPIWVALGVLQGVLGANGVRTGARFRLVGAPKTIGARAEVRQADKVAPASDPRGDEYVLMVTDVRARPKRKGVTFVAGRLPKADTTVTVEPEAWRRFEAASDGAADNKRGKRDVDLRDDVSVGIENQSRGEALRQRQGLTDPKSPVGLREGHVLWARLDRSAESVQITELSFAQTWRHAAHGEQPTTGSRIPPGFLPCTGEAGLCPACRVFGAANTRGGRRGADRPYRGQVRFGEFAVSGDLEEVDLPPMGQPRPGSGQMYLAHSLIPQGSSARARLGEVALREWGSALDAPVPRPIRGRKFYWRVGDAPGRPPRWKFHASQAGEENRGKMLARAQVVKPGARLAGALAFENLTEAELGALLATLKPALISDQQHSARQGTEGEFCLTIGGGKPLGMGACVVTDLRLRLEEDRYRGSGRDSRRPEDLVAAFVAQSSKGLRDVWQDFLEMVRLNAVDPALVSYPRDKPWPRDPNDSGIYKAGFDWWMWSAGIPRDGLVSTDDEVQARHSYAVLPTPTAQDPRLPVQLEGRPVPPDVREQTRSPAPRGRQR